MPSSGSRISHLCSCLPKLTAAQMFLCGNSACSSRPGVSLAPQSPPWYLSYFEPPPPYNASSLYCVLPPLHCCGLWGQNTSSTLSVIIRLGPPSFRINRAPAHHTHGLSRTDFLTLNCQHPLQSRSPDWLLQLVV